MRYFACKVLIALQPGHMEAMILSEKMEGIPIRFETHPDCYGWFSGRIVFSGIESWYDMEGDYYRVEMDSGEIHLVSGDILELDRAYDLWSAGKFGVN